MLVVLIVLYVGTQLVSSLTMASPTMDTTQRRIMVIMPLFFVIFIINFPAGVIVYWITTNTWTIAQQYVIRRRIGPVGPTATATATTGGGGGGGGLSGLKLPRLGGGNGAQTTDGNGSSGGLGSLLRGRPKPSEEPAAVGGGKRSGGSGGSRGASGSGGGKSSGSAQRQRGGPPPPSPKKKKKRSGRRR